MTVPYASCTDAYRAWAQEAVPATAIQDWAIVLPDGTRCPIQHTPPDQRAEVVVQIPPGQPAYQRVDIEDHPVPWTVVVAGVVLWLVMLVALWSAWRFGKQESD